MMRYICFLGLCSYAFALSEFELHKINQAHSQGHTGRGITIGVADDAFNNNHLSLKNQLSKSIYLDSTTPDLQNKTHGSHVAGIIAGERFLASPLNDFYGVAYEGKLISAGIFPSSSQTNAQNQIYEFFKDVKIINNSWGINYYPYLDLKASNTGLTTCEQTVTKNNNQSTTVNVCKTPIKYVEKADKVANDMMKLAKEKQVLNVFAAGNEGVLAPGLHAALPYYDESLRAWLTVGALDASHITQKTDGTLVVSSKGLADFGNGLLGARNFSLLATGAEINSVDSKSNNALVKKSGTSMAAPFVSGAAALVAQKFPFLTGKQIADVLLSTANKNYEVPKLVLKQVKDGTNTPKFLMVYLSELPSTEEAVKKDLEEIYGNVTIQSSNQTKKYVDYIWENRDKIQATKLINATTNNIEGIVKLEKEDLFGQGILDASKALKGLALLDANRLSDADTQSYYKEALAAYYTVDTQGYSAEFSNDIAQRKWEENTHLNTAMNKPSKLQNLNVGFIKDGEGMLILSGKNSYEGATIVKKGHLKIKGELKRKSYVEESGVLSGNGILQNDLNNKGTVRPGNEDLSDLTVRGAYTQEGANSKLQLDFGQEKNSKLIANSYDIKGGKLEYIPLPQYYTLYQETRIDMDEKLREKLTSFDEVLIQNNHALNFAFALDSDKQTINKGAFVAKLKPNAYEIPQTTLGSALRKIRKRRDLSADYQNFFARLDSGIKTEKTLKKIEGKAYLNTFTHHNQAQTVSNNLLLSLNPQSNFVFNEKILLAGDYLPRILGDERYFILSPHYQYFKDKDFEGHKTGAKLSIAQNLGDNFLAYGLAFSNSRFYFDDESHLRSNNFDLFLNHNRDLSWARLLSGVALSLASNETQRQINQSLNGSYKSFQSALQLGLSKDFLLGQDWTVNPLFYLNYSFFHQQSFKENKALMAKAHDGINHHSSSVNFGFNLTKNLQNETYQSAFSGFALFEKIVWGRYLDNRASFLDFPLHFTQRQKLKDEVLRLGFSSEFLYNNWFLQAVLTHSFSQDAYDLSSVLSIGRRF